MAGRVTIQDVARLAGVSPATVSTVINNRPSVKASTAQAVRQIMAELDYVPAAPGQRRGYRENPNAGRKTNRIALIVSSIKQSVFQSAVYADAVSGLLSAAREHEKSVIISFFNPEANGSQKVLTQRVDGTILFGSTQSPVLLRALQKQPCVQMMGPVDPSGLFDHVTYDNALIGKLAAEYLLSCGHRTCAFLGDPAAVDIAGQRGTVFCESIESAGGKVLCVPYGDMIKKDHAVHFVDPDQMAHCLDQILRSPLRPSGLFLPMDILTYAAYMQFYKRGDGCEKNLTVVTCNNEEALLAHLQPRPAVIDIHSEMVGYRAMEQLLWRIAHPIHPRVKHLLEPSLLKPVITQV